MRASQGAVRRAGWWQAVALVAALGPCSAESSELRVRVATATGRTAREVWVDGAAERQVWAAASLGQLTGGGSRWLYHPPSSGAPFIAVLVFAVDNPGAPPSVAVTRVPVVGTAELSVATESRGELRIEIEGRIHGPFRADAQGSVRVPVEVAPGTASVRVAARSATRQVERVVALPPAPPSAPALLVFPVPLPRGAGGWLLSAAAEAGDALQLDLTGATARAEAGTVGVLVHHLAPQATSSQVEVRVRASEGSAASATIVVGSAPLDVRESRMSVALRAGGFFAGGSNAGPLLELEFAHRLPWGSGRLFGEVSLGLRHQRLAAATTLGSLESTVTHFPASLALRVRLLRLRPWDFFARAGVALVGFRHSVHSDFQPAHAQAGLGVLGFGALQASFRVASAVEIFGELAGAAGQAKTRQLDANPGGLVLAVGARYQLP